MRILKFGGSSVRDAERIAHVVELLREREDAERDGSGRATLAVVVSALGGVTDLLLEAARLATHDHDRAAAVVEGVEQRHLAIIEQLAPNDEKEALRRRLSGSFADLRALVRGISLLQECTPKARDRLLAYGERLAAALVAAALRARGVAAEDCDARPLLRTDRTFGNAKVDTVAAYAAIRKHFQQTTKLQVVTGFLGSTSEGETTTLGRGGSDLTAALLGAALQAPCVEIWTDVDGVMSADPRSVDDAFSLPSLSYEELMELSHFGAKVVYPPTVQPARAAGVELLICNTLNPAFPGTRVVEQRPEREEPVSDRQPADRPVTGITSIPEVALLRLEGDGLMGVSGVARRLFDVLAREAINVILITQASSEHSICFAIAPQDAARASAAIDAEFTLERQNGAVRPAIVEEALSVIAVVGEGMRERPGLSGRLFRVLGRRGINVRAIAQGSSELNISVVVRAQDQRTALRSLHDAFFRADDRRLDVFLAGTGGVGAEVARQLLAAGIRRGIELRLVGVCDSRRMLLDWRGIEAPEDGTWRTLLETRGVPLELGALAGQIAEGTGLRAFVDCTPSDQPASIYGRLLRSGCAVVAANKVPFSGPLERYREIHHHRRSFNRGLYYETTVGAGLPVLLTLRSLIDGGDAIAAIEGVFSGTLGFLLSRLEEGVRLSVALRDASERGLTEPDPRDDLSGLDVARKLLILARETGLELEPEDVEVEPLVDQELLGCASLADFWELLPSRDDAVARRVEEAAAAGGHLRYLARLRDGHARVGLETVPRHHPCASLHGTDNLFAFTTSRYRDRPLVVRGPGAGTVVTAAGVIADLLQAHAEAAPDRLIDMDPSFGAS